MSDELRELLRILIRKHGFELDVPFASAGELVQGIREIELLAPESVLTDVQRRALLENLRRVIFRTASREDSASSVAAQASLPRWQFLRAASEEAANAYVEVLRYLQVEVPQTLKKGR